MSKFELSINTKYLPAWDAWCGIREFISNGMDAEVEFDAPLKVTHHNNTLRIENEGVTLVKEALLFGTSSKTNRTDTIGTFGEGIKLGTLALVRAGHEVKIRTGGEVWTAYIARSEKYAADVLHFDCKGGNKDEKRVRVEIAGISLTEWRHLKERFLFLTPPPTYEHVKVDRGDLLLAPRYKGQIYVKGVFVQPDSRLVHGYNFQHASVDRDRRMVSSWDREYEAGRMWTEAVATRPDLIEPFYQLLLNGDPDVAGVGLSVAPAETLAAVANKFTTQFGADALPAANMGESADIGRLGKRGIVVRPSLGKLLAETLGNATQVAQKLQTEILKTYSWHELEIDQQEVLTANMKLIADVRPAYELSRVNVVDFRSPTIMGQAKDGQVFVAKRLVDDRDELLATLIHEFAHDFGGDGAAEHIMAIENIWRDIVKELRK